VSRRWHRTWGATKEEACEELPGDEFVAAVDLQTTRSITISAAPNASGASDGWVKQLELHPQTACRQLHPARRARSDVTALRLGRERRAPPGAAAPGARLLRDGAWDAARNQTSSRVPISPEAPNRTRRICLNRSNRECSRSFPPLLGLEPARSRRLRARVLPSPPRKSSSDETSGGRAHQW
jgi:hypothetical protein